MWYLLLSLLLVGCVPAQAEEPKAASPMAVEVMPGVFVTPFDFPCGNGGTMCGDAQICFNGNCLTICGSHECFIEMETAYDSAEICPQDSPPMTTTMKKWRALKSQHRR